MRAKVIENLRQKGMMAPIFAQMRKNQRERQSRAHADERSRDATDERLQQYHYINYRCF